MEREESMGGGESRDSTAGEGRMEKGGGETASCAAGVDGLGRCNSRAEG